MLPRHSSRRGFFFEIAKKGGFPLVYLKIDTIFHSLPLY
jgi:hypothetical protein